MRHRPPKHVREQMRADANLANLVLRGDLAAARQEAQRIAAAAERREQRAAEFYRSRGIR
jgi:hypothetical protein